MRYTELGRTGVRVSSITLGCAFFGGHVDRAESRRIVHRALDLGVNSIDTAESYLDPSPGVSEELLGEILQGRRQEVFLASKVNAQRGWHAAAVNRGLTRRVVLQAVEGSLRRLNTDHLDLIYAHSPDPTTPLEETLTAFDDLVRAGKVRYAGLSNHSAAQFVEALWIAERRNLRPVAATQDLYNLLERAPEAELYPTCRRFGIGAFVYAALAGGVLSAKYSQAVVRGEEAPPSRSRPTYFGRSESGRASSSPVLNDHTVTAAVRLRGWAEARGHTAAQAAAAWVLGEPAVTSVILGVSSVEQLEANAPGFDWELTPAERAEVGDLVAAAAASPP